jgi:hypothetical protein
MYFHEAMQGAAFPYGIYYIIDGDTDYDFSDEHETVEVQFSLFSEKNAPDEAFTLGGYLKALFDNAALSVSGYSLISWKRKKGPGKPVRDEENATWTHIFEYEALLEKART